MIRNSDRPEPIWHFFLALLTCAVKSAETVVRQQRILRVPIQVRFQPVAKQRRCAGESAKSTKIFTYGQNNSFPRRLRQILADL